MFKIFFTRKNFDEFEEELNGWLKAGTPDGQAICPTAICQSITSDGAIILIVYYTVKDPKKAKVG